jgi:class 3 adenylate cyclase
MKLWVWCFGFPVIFMSACWIHVWPLMIAGNPKLYLYFHAANYLVIIMATTLIAPPPRYLIAIILGILALFVVPIAYIFYSLENFTLLKFFLNDSAYGLCLSVLSAYMNFTLRRKVATEDVINKSKFEKFVGNLVSTSIFENDASLVKDRSTHAFIMSMDIRGFTSLSQTPGANSSLFKERYHAEVARIVGVGGGFIHKTHGDGHLISFGLVDDVNLDDVPSIQEELKKTEIQRRKHHLAKAIEIFEEILLRFSVIKADLKITQDVAVCAAVDFGEISLKILGDPDVRLEFDIDGLVVIRCTRLEAYTKTLRQVLSPKNSFLVLSASAAQHLSTESYFKIFLTAQNPIKDFPKEGFVCYREYQHRKALKIAS